MSEGLNSSAIQRLENLLDEDSFVELGSLVTARVTDFNLDPKKAPSDGVVTGYGLIDERLVFVYSQDSSVLNGTIGEMHAKKILNVYEKAMKMGAPVIGLLDCGGVRLQEAFDATEAIGEMIAKACEASGSIPQITGIFGNCGGGLSVLPALSDFAYMTNDAKLFVNSPDAITGNSSEKNDTSSAQFQFDNGNVDGIGSEEEVLDKIRQMVAVLPSSAMDGAFADECLDDLNRASVGLEEKREEVAAIAAELSDANIFVETKAGFSKDMITGFVILNGQTTGVVGNQAVEAGEILTANGARKAASFVKFCDAYEIPVLSLTNVDAYKACECAEKNLPKALAELSIAFASATVPKVNLITKKAGGSAYLFMNGKSLGADLTFAFPDAEMSIMDSNLAGGILAGESGDVAKASLEFEETQSGLMNAARRGIVDRVVNFADARKYLIAGFDMLFEKSDSVYKKHSAK
ncbi:MAG: carboxyl transferase [Lachnospiraceae bacterium]|nr:carboxyl transferase [Lachnospiraceae bacterium]